MLALNFSISIHHIQLETVLVRSEDLNNWVAGQNPGPWIDQLREAVAEYELETGGSRNISGSLHRMAGRMGARSEKETARSDAAHCSSCQGAGSSTMWLCWTEDGIELAAGRMTMQPGGCTTWQ